MQNLAELQYIQTLAFEYNMPDLEFVGVSDKGISSYNAILKTSDGRQFFVKQYKQDDAERRENSNLIERYISVHSSVPVVLPLETTSGNYQVYVEGKMYTVFPYQDHNDTAPDSAEEKQKQIYQLAKTLGLIHSIPTTELIGVDTIERWAPKEISERIAHLEHIQKTIGQRETLDEFDSLALKVIRERKMMLSKIDVPNTVTVADTICHGDYHSQNVLFDTQMEIVGVVDWDICGLSDPYVDFLNSFKMTVIGRKYDTYQVDCREDANSFIKGYMAGASFEFDIARLKNAANTLAQVVVGSSWPLDEHYFMDYTKADGHLEKELLKAQFFNQSRTEMVHFISIVLNEVKSSIY